MRVFWLLALTGCFVDEKTPAPDFACEGVQPPATAPDSVKITGVVRSLAGDVNLPGVTVQGFASGLPLTPITSDANGEFSFSHETGGVPNNDNISGMADGFLPTIAYPGAPVFADSFFELRMLDLATVMKFAMDAEIPLDVTAGTALVRVTDCNESPVPGGKLTVPAPGNVFYFRFAAPVLTETETDASGIALITNLPLGAVTISGTVGEVALRDNPVDTVPNAFIQTLARP